MPVLSKLTVSNVRNVVTAGLELNPSFNIFYGVNGAGKTSLLEAISLISTSRSFRTNKTQYIVNYLADEAVAAGEILSNSVAGTELRTKIGVAKPRSGKGEARIDGQSVKAASELARLVPTITIEPSSFRVVEGGPQDRRPLLDWLVFHVKPSFFSAYKDYQRCLKQRNKLLRSDKIRRQDLIHWDQLLCRAAVVVDRAREQAVTALSEALLSEYSSYFNELDIDLSFKSGWGEPSKRKQELESVVAGEKDQHDRGQGEDTDEHDQDLIEAYMHQLGQCFDRDQSLGYTTLGSHKFDLKMRACGKPAAEVLSRGQKKQLVVCLFLSLASVFREHKGQLPLVMLDDLPSELDKDKLAWLLSSLMNLGAQTFITSIEPLLIEDLIGIDPAKASWFHVKHGSVIAVKDIGTN